MNMNDAFIGSLIFKGIAKPCNYIKFKFAGFGMPNLKVNADYCIECTFNEPTYIEDHCSFGNAGNTKAFHCTTWRHAFYMGTGTASLALADWSSGEHTVKYNDANHKIIFDGVEVSDYTPITENRVLTVGCRNYIDVKNIAYGSYIKSYKITSLSTGDTLCNLIPYDFGGQGVFYDEINNVAYAPEGALPIDTIPLMMMTPLGKPEEEEE